ncbi:VirK/YbjX family protein [Moritella dasanensis]|uniref:VirK/YbjX family protein n=1 Tax=Moritella dasanensis TaxID=428031 RepID=UPI0002D7020F|nr:VirK/YbjX family protein [Moritella dasanensis]
MSKINIFKLADQIYPNVKGIKKIQKKGRFCFWALTNSKSVNTMATLFSRNNLKAILANNPSIMEKPLKPYICANWSGTERIKYLTEHYQFIDDTFGFLASTIISNKGVNILSFESLSGLKCRVLLYQGSSREGGLGIRLVNEKCQNIYALTCNISGTHTKTMHIGALQGASHELENRHALIKELTKSLHGLRPKSLLVEMALMLARVLGVREVKAISNKGHIYQALRYIGSKRNSVTFDYDGLWDEFEATKEDAYFYSLPVFTPRKDPLTLKKTKRKMYTKRYQWLDDSEVAMANNLTPWLMNPPAINPTNSAIADSADNLNDSSQAA